MILKVLTPARVFLERDDVKLIVLETPAGNLGIRPRRLDGVVPVSPGILTFEIAGGKRADCAIDEGILVKTGETVLVSVRHAAESPADRPGSLKETLRQRIEAMREHDSDIRAMLATMESRFIRRWSEGRRHG